MLPRGPWQIGTSMPTPCGKKNPRDQKNPKVKYLPAK